MDDEDADGVSASGSWLPDPDLELLDLELPDSLELLDFLELPDDFLELPEFLELRDVMAGVVECCEDGRADNDKSGSRAHESSSSGPDFKNGNWLLMLAVSSFKFSLVASLFIPLFFLTCN